MPECLHAKYVDTLMKQVTPYSYDAQGVSDEKAATQKALGLTKNSNCIHKFEKTRWKISQMAIFTE